uniref:Uncharacterized protein n=1 Tax=Utricularia reniformis TaxID=192314 RepID=A0A1Y0B3X7_9LAMI|nr:hypothetical protein AEK19_MT1994 [Utricularia reniformis]ART32156.1 hypothetical protein AEK19_MT1994 [Utricularia reniformis]
MDLKVLANKEKSRGYILERTAHSQHSSINQPTNFYTRWNRASRQRKLLCDLSSSGVNFASEQSLQECFLLTQKVSALSIPY